MSEFWTLVILVSIYIAFSFIVIFPQDALHCIWFQPIYVDKEQVITEFG